MARPGSAVNFKNVRGVLLDISGVLLDGNVPIPGSVKTFQRIQRSGIPFKLVTNETQKNRSALSKKLQLLGFDVQVKDIHSPAPAAAVLLKDRQLRPHLLVHDNLLPEFCDLDTGDPNCVVIGDVPEKFHFGELNKAFNILINLKEPRLFSLGIGKYYKEDGKLMLDVGAFTTALEYACDLKAEVIGKPSELFFKAALDQLEIAHHQAVMVGDDLLFDVGGCQKSNIKGVLVRTGKYQPSFENHPIVKPDLIVDNLEQFVDEYLL